MLFQTHSCSNIYFQVVVKCFWVKSWFGLIAMFSEVIPFGVKWLIRGRRVLKQVLKILHASGEWHLKRDPDELPFCAGAQRSALFCQWDLASSRLKLVLCPRKKLKAVDANGHWVRWNVVPMLKEGCHAFCIGWTIAIMTLFFGSSEEQNFRTERVWLTKSRIKNFSLFWMEIVHLKPSEDLTLHKNMLVDSFS